MGVFRSGAAVDGSCGGAKFLPRRLGRGPPADPNAVRFRGARRIPHRPYIRGQDRQRPADVARPTRRAPRRPGTKWPPSSSSPPRLRRGMRLLRGGADRPERHRRAGRPTASNWARRSAGPQGSTPRRPPSTPSTIAPPRRFRTVRERTAAIRRPRRYVSPRRCPTKRRGGTWAGGPAASLGGWRPRRSVRGARRPASPARRNRTVGHGADSPRGVR
mmetsp:Transcript_360/g.1061  ORF Transcript_360/g.1061 Transcript_360/m.1061 type:complete len:217 (-) Transcript_360:553-1203(-)